MGIDTGGTFTDTVIWDTEAKKVLSKSKAFTTHDDLTLGINTCLDELDLSHKNQIQAVHLSTTLAVNNILENKTHKLGLILLGRHIHKKLPVHGKYEIIKYQYNEKKNSFMFDANVKQDVCKKFGMGFPIIMISSADGIKYPQAEKAAAESLANLIDSQIICCSDISEKNDFYERTLHATTTIGLRDIVTDWGACIMETLKEYSIDVPVKILTGTGDLISLGEATISPLKTIMSGPAASFIGSTCLTDETDYLLLDMGGTSVDITKVEKRSTRSAPNKRTIGKYDYNIETLDLQSFGTGGDSIIRLNGLGDIVVGPDKVIPLCIIGSRAPHLNDELKQYLLEEDYDLLTADETDCYFANREKPLLGLTKEEIRIVKLLMDKPHSLFFLADYFDKDADALHMDRVLEKGNVIKASLTPTDILHAEGVFTRWNTTIAQTGVKIISIRKHYKSQQLIKEVKRIITKQLVFSCMQSIAGFEQKSFSFNESAATMYLIDKFLDQNDGLLSSRFAISKPIIGVGAPARAWLPPVAEKLGSSLILPEDGDVACAIGAAAGRVL